MQEDRKYSQIPIEKLPIAMAYVPWQRWEELYDLDKGFMCGTIFPSLNKPFAEIMSYRGGYR